MAAHSLSYCAQLVKDHDPDRFLLTMLMRPEFHEDLLTLFAFNYEIAKTREVVSETMLGLMRLQWWREQIKALYDGTPAPEHEILEPLAALIKKRNLSNSYFETLIYAREFDLEGVLPANMDGLMNYCDFTSSPLMSLVLEVMGEDPESESVHPAALNYAVMGILRAVPFHARQRRCFLPEDALKSIGQNINGGLYEMKPAERLPEVIAEIAGVFTIRLKPRNTYLKAAHLLARQYHGQLKGQKFNVFSPKLLLPPPFKALRLWLGLKFS